MKSIVHFVSADRRESLTARSLHRIAMIASCVASLAFAASLHAQVIAQYVISTANDDTVTIAASSVASNLTANSLTQAGVNDFVPGGGNGSLSGVFVASNWASGASPDPAKYFEFSLTPQAGFQVSFASLTYALAQGSSATDWQLHYSTDAFASSDVTIATHNIGTPNQQSTFTDNFSFTSGSTVTFRLFGYNDASGGGSAQGGGLANNTGALAGTGSDLIVNGTVSAIPEPAMTAILLGGAMLAFGISRRRSRSA